MSNFRPDAACIVGIGRSKWGTRAELVPVGTTRLAFDAITDACADAGVDPKDVDGFSGWCDDPTLPSELSLLLQTRELTYSGMVWGGRGSGMPGAVLNAYLAVATGAAKYVVVVRSLVQTYRLGQSIAAGVGPDQPIPVTASYTAPFGSTLAPLGYALRMRRHMALYGTTIDHLAEISVNARRNAANNPSARFRNEITVEDHHNSRIIADPLRLLDCCMESDGAGAVLVTTAERAADLRQPAVTIRAVSTSHEPSWNLTWSLDDDTLASTGHRPAARELYGRSGVTPQDVDVALIYDGFTPSVLMSIEDWGFCSIGDGGPFVAEGNIRREGKIPVNTHGGNLAEVYLQGITHLMEGVRQLRGTSCNQIADAELALYASGIGAAAGGGILLSRS